MKKINNILLIIIIIVAGVALLSECDKDMKHPVPDVHVDFRIDLQITYKLNTIGGWEYFTGGYRGIVIYRASEDEFSAFDRACTHNIYNSIVVNDPPIAECEECGSSYLLIDGSVVNGPAKHQLKQYRTILDYPYLYVRNYY